MFLAASWKYFHPYWATQSTRGHLSIYTEQFLGYNFTWVSSLLHCIMVADEYPKRSSESDAPKWYLQFFENYQPLLKVQNWHLFWGPGPVGWKPWEMKGFCWGACCIPPWCMVIWKINATSTGAVKWALFASKMCCFFDVSFFFKQVWPVLFHWTCWKWQVRSKFVAIFRWLQGVTTKGWVEKS